MMGIQTVVGCTGCSACYSICPRNCIKMSFNSEGFLFPEIKESDCIKCRKCENVCPILNPLEPKQSLKETYAFINNDESVRYMSSSGGVYSALTKKLFDAKGGNVFVFGASFSGDCKSVIHSVINNYADIEKFRGSKYTQSTINNSYKKCKKLLDTGKTVCFSGTPCQIGGLKAFLRKEYENLFTIDFICHGVPSPLLWRRYVEYREVQNGTKITSASFRRKNLGWENYSLWFSFTNNSEYSQIKGKDPYIQMFLKHLCMRPSCYDCKFKTVDRLSDITMADFWGIQQECPNLNDDKGINFVIVHSVKGKELFDSLSNCVKKSVSLESGLKHNPSMIKSCEMPDKRKTFFKDLVRVSFEKMIKKYVVTPWYVRGYWFVGRCARKVLQIIGLKK